MRCSLMRTVGLIVKKDEVKVEEKKTSTKTDSTKDKKEVKKND